MEALKEYAGDDPVKMAVLHSAIPDDAADLLARVKQEFNVAEAYLQQIGPIVGTHAGPGLLGVMMIKA